MCKKMREFKVTMLGSGGVGKSALTLQFIAEKFMTRYDPTIEDFYRKYIVMDNSPCLLEVLDTAGTEQFSSMRDLYIRNGESFIIVYSITSSQSFEEIRAMQDLIMHIKGTRKVPMLLVGNKLDLEAEREVPAAKGMALALQWDCPFIELSAKNSKKVNELFTRIVREIVKDSKKQKKKCCIIS